jgi:hypothetical protein
MVRFYRRGAERIAVARVYQRLSDSNFGKHNSQQGYRTMWLSLFAIAAGAAICLSVAAILMQPTAGRIPRG